MVLLGTAYRFSISCSTPTRPRSATAYQNDKDLGPSTFRFAYLEPYADAARTWLHDAAEVVDTTHIPPEQAARQIADAVLAR